MMIGGDQQKRIFIHVSHSDRRGPAVPFTHAYLHVGITTWEKFREGSPKFLYACAVASLYSLVP